MVPLKCGVEKVFNYPGNEKRLSTAHFLYGDSYLRNDIIVRFSLTVD